MSLPAVELRRRIGYVIQQVGLFPHLTVGENVAVVPRLLGWTAERIRARTDELLDLIGLEPAATETGTRPSCPEASGSASASRARWPRTRR